MYVELHARSGFSFLRGASHPEELATAAAHIGCPALALTDRMGVYGAPRHYAKAKELGTKAIVGAELVLGDGAALPVLVQDARGYKNLCSLLATAHLRSAKGEAYIGTEELRDSVDGLVALTGSADGPLVRAWQNSGSAAAASLLNELKSIFGDRLFLELNPPLTREDSRMNRELAGLGASAKVPLVATNAVEYAAKPARMVADAFTCLREHTTLDGAGRQLARNSDRCLKPAAAMASAFADHPEALSNTVRIADSISYSLEQLYYRFPDFPVPAGETVDTYLAHMVYFGAHQRYGAISPTVHKQLQRELALIQKLGFSGYFLIVWDLVNFAREHGVLVQGRGSAANSAVCYSLGITAVDPISCRLLFERFLSEGRKSWPDIDLDLPSGERRESVIQEVFRKYGPRGAALTANVITFQARNTAREMGKILGFGDEILDRFSSLYAHGDFPQTLPIAEQMRLAGLPPQHPRSPLLLDLCRRVIGLPRHLGQHSGGMIIAHGGRLDHVVPLENASMPGRVVIQWNKDDIEDLGIVKVDLLGLGMMAALQDSLTLCQERGRPVDLARIPKDDAKTFELMQKADAIGVFQIESRAQMATLPRLKPACFYDVALQVAIIRPGPIQGEAVHPLLARRAGREPVTYPDERVKDILERTLGVTLFQEQIIAIAMRLAGFTADEADELRRAIGFSRSDERMRKMEAKLRSALLANNVTPSAADQIANSLQTFSLYGFPESHALSFALIAYASAYLKAHRASEFFVGLLNNQPMGFYSVATLIQDARRHGLRIRPVCVASSEWETTVVGDDELRIGLNQVRGLHKVNTVAMLETRRVGPFISIADFLSRTRFSAADRRRLALAGALNALSGHRRAALWQVEGAVGADDLFSGVPVPGDELTPLEVMTIWERIAADYRTQALTAGEHPMRFVRESLPGVLRAVDLADQPNGKEVAVAGTVICRQRPGTAKGFVFVSLEDETGIANVIVSPALFEKERPILTQEPNLIVRGRLQIFDGVIHVKARTLETLGAIDLPTGTSHDFH